MHPAGLPCRQPQRVPQGTLARTERGRQLGREAGQPHPRFAVRRGAKATPAKLRKGGRPRPVSDLHLPLGDHGIHLVSHRAALSWSKDPPLVAVAWPTQSRPFGGQLPFLSASGARPTLHFRRFTVTSRASVNSTVVGR